MIRNISLKQNLLFFAIKMENFEYSENELSDLDKNILLEIADNYNLSLRKTSDRKDIIDKILDYQDEVEKRKLLTSKQNGKFNNLPLELIRLLALYLDGCDIVNLCKLNKKLNNIICKDDRFLISLGHQRLTEYDERLSENNKILEEIKSGDLYDASRKGYEKKVEYLVSRGVDVDGGDGSAPDFTQFYRGLSQIGGILHIKRSPLLAAAENNYFDIVEYLISRGANIRVNNNLLLEHAAAKGNIRLIDYLLSHGIDIHVDDDIAVKSAAYAGNLNMVKYLVSRGADNPANSSHILIYVASRGDLDMLKYLAQNGADLEILRDYPIATSKIKQHPEIIKYLKSQNIDL